MSVKRAYQLSVVLLVGLVVGPAAPGQVPVETEPDEVVRIDANLVTIPAQVMDPTAKGTLREAEEQEALIYSVQFGAIPLRPTSNTDGRNFNKTIENANEYMAGIAQNNGGRHYRVEDITDLKKTFGEVGEELRRQYSLAYYPKIPLTKGQRRQIRVSVRRPNLAVRARDSYVAVPPQRRKP